MTKIHIACHTHWDREWYFSSMDSWMLSEQLFGDIIEELSRNTEVNFCLDGQSSIIKDYLILHPEKTKEVKELIKHKRLYVGPWYTQSDCLVPHEESIMRNMQVGVRDIKSYGSYMPIGYLPDTFGFNAQMPTIIRHIGLDNILFWRGINLKKQVKSPYFKWKGLGEKKIYSVSIPNSYSAASLIDSSDAFVNNRLKPAVEFINQNVEHDDVLIAAGGDQLNIVKNVQKIIFEINKKMDDEVIVSNYPDFMETIRKKGNLEIYEGDFREPSYARLHRSIGSVRYSIKSENSKIEQKLLKKIEPLLVIARQNGIAISTELLIQLWKKVLQCQAHDSMGGCVTDNIFDDIMHRFKEAQELCDSIENTIMYKIHEYANLSNDEILIVNTDAKKYHGYKEITFVAPNKNICFEGVEDAFIISEKKFEARENILTLTAEDGYTYIDEPEYCIFTAMVKVELPALGYKTIKMKFSSQPLSTIKKCAGNSISINDKTVSFNNGKISYQDGKHIIENIISIVDCGNDGDTYDFSPFIDDKEVELNFEQSYVLEYENYKTLVITGTTLLPKILEDRVSNNPQLEEFKIELYLTLNCDSKLLDGRLIFNNNIDSHRLRIRFNTNNDTIETISQIQAGFQTRKNIEIPENWPELYSEKPVNLFNFQRSISCVKQDESFTIYSNELKEYEKKGKYIYLTVIATTGELGKPYLQWRPGRASGDTTMQGHVMIPTPTAQEHRIIETKFAICLENNFNEFDVYTTGDKWCLPNISYQSQKLNCFINRLDNKLQKSMNKIDIAKEFSLFEIDENLVINSIHPSFYDDQTYIVRFINPTEKEIIFPQNIFNEQYSFVNAIEEVAAHVKTIKPYDFVTVKVKYR